MVNMYSQMNYLKLHNKNIESLLETLKSLKVNLEFDDPEKLREFSEILSKRYFFKFPVRNLIIW